MKTLLTRPDDLPVVEYAAKSSPDPRDSTSSQIAAIDARVAELGGRFVVGAFHESAPGYRRSRGPELEAAITAAVTAADKHGQAELWVFHSSRFARGSGKKGEGRALGKLYWDLLDRGVLLRSVEDDEFVSNPNFVGVASVQSHKYSEDLSAHLRRGKQDQWKRGERLGGPVPDGYLLRIQRDESDRVTARRYLFDPARETAILRLWSLAEDGLPPATVARRLNGEGHRRASGSPWDRRSVEDKLLNAFYAGFITRGRSTLRATAERRPADHPRYIEPEQWEAVVARIPDRDRAKGSDRRPKGRPNSNHLLAQLAVCLRCGEPMRPKTSSYRRKSDGGRARSYVCRHVADGTGLCDAPVIDAETIEPAIINRLNGYFIDFGGWVRAHTERHAAARAGISELIAAEERMLASLEGQGSKLAEAYTRHTTEDDEMMARADAQALDILTGRRAQTMHRLTELRATLAAAEAEEADPINILLDLYNELAAEVRGALARGRLQDVNEGLRARFDAFWLDKLPDGSVAVLPMLVNRGTHAEMIATLQGSDGGLLVREQEPIVPAASPLTIPCANLRNAHA